MIRKHFAAASMALLCLMTVPAMAQQQPSFDLVVRAPDAVRELLEDHLQIKRYREKHACSLAEATTKGFGRDACALYEEITGFPESNANALFHHRLSLYGPPCHSCGKPLRTPQETYCPMCGTERKLPAEDRP